MPTENRSSNTELSKIVTEALVGMVSGVTGMKPPADEPLPGFIQAPIDRAVTRISGLLAKPAPQPHPEPIAWMVGTAFWWTKEEAERDAEAMGLPVVTLGPCVGPGDFERLRAELVESDHAFVRASTEAEQLRAQLAERDALLVKANYVIDHARTIDKQAFGRGTQNVDHGLFRGLGNLLAQYDEALSASAEPEAT